jgi:hypothetical protein
VNKEAAIKAVDKIIQKSLARKGLFLCTMPIHEIVDAVLGELFGWKAKNAEECLKCPFNRNGWYEMACTFEFTGWIDSEDFWLTCPKPEKPRP